MMLRRRAIRRDVIEWTRSLGYEPAAHHKLFLTEMCALMESTSYDTLLLFAPPGSAKSHHVSVAFPPWWMAKYPARHVLAASHGAEFADKWGRRVRNLVASRSNDLNIELAQDSQAAGRWQLKTGGEYLAAGVQMGIAGFRADLGIIDDPFASKQDAYSETVRERVWEWYINDFSARLKPNAKRVIMHTRWHEDDLAGRIILQAEQNGHPVRIVTVPAIAGPDDVLGRKEGEYLWDEPDGYNYAAFLRRRQSETPPQEWAAIYQQHPVPEGGGYFKLEWLKYYDARPNNLRTYGASDYAVTDKGGDYTEHGVAGIDPESNLYLLDWWSGQTPSDVWVDVLIDMAARHQPLSWAEESGQIIKSLGPFIEQRMRERNVSFYREQFTSVADKPTRAQGIRGRMSLGKVFLPRHAPWVPRLVAQLLAFPAGKHDDGVDVLSLFGRLLDQMFPPTTSPAYKAPRSIGGWQGM